MTPEELFRANLTTIERVVREVCRGTRMQPHEVDDFGSSVMVALMEHDFAILRRWEGRSSLAGYLSVVIRRLLADERDRRLGRWYPSAEATRMGAAGVLLEKLLLRDGLPLDEAVPIVCSVEPSASAKELEAMARRFPPRAPRLRAVELDAVEEANLSGADRADARATSGEVRRLSRQASDVVRHTIETWGDEDAMILRFRFGESMSIADISRMLRIPQRPLYRRVETLLERLRAALVTAGLDAAALSGVIGEASQEMDFGLGGGKEPSPESSVTVEHDSVATGEERS